MSHPRNPVSGKNNRPRELGQTRTQNGHLEYKNPLTDKWERAVRLQTIRADLLRRADPQQYKYPKHHGNTHGHEPTNYTAFLPKDKNVGTVRANRPDILFQIYNHDIRSVRPTGYVKDNGRIILDAFDHGLRNFPELPVALSSELEGSDIEYYYRQNAEIADYDLIARMPNGYATGKDGRRRHEGPPRVGTINQRAQRFRTRAACIAWCKREGTRTKNDMILSIIPDECKDPAINSTKNFRELNKAEVDLVEKKNKGTMPSRVRSQQKRRAKDSDDDEGNGDRHGNDASHTDDEWALTSIETPQESVESGQTRPHPTTSSRTLPRQTSLLANPPTTIESPAMPSRMTLRSRRLISPPAPSTDEDSRASVDSPQHTPVGRTTAHRETGTKSCPPRTVTETSPSLHEEAESSNAGRKRRHQMDDIAASDEEESQRRAGPHNIIETPHMNYYIARRAMMHQVPDIPLEELTREVLQAHNAWTMSDARLRRQQARPAHLGFDPEFDEAFKAETQQGIRDGDYRYMAPSDHGWKEEDKLAIQRALELTRIQFCDLKGDCVPGDLAQYMYESYASQWRRIQDYFEAIWTIFSTPTALYRLPKWRNGFSNWKVPRNDALGQSLMKQLKMGERALADMEKDFQEEDRLEAEEKARKMAAGEGGEA